MEPINLKAPPPQWHTSCSRDASWRPHNLPSQQCHQQWQVFRYMSLGARDISYSYSKHHRFHLDITLSSHRAHRETLSFESNLQRLGLGTSSESICSSENKMQFSLLAKIMFKVLWKFSLEVKSLQLRQNDESIETKSWSDGLNFPQ